MSCWCDGEDPGCHTCFPRMLEAERVIARTIKKSLDQLVNLAMDPNTTGDELINAAKTFREAACRRGT